MRIIQKRFFVSVTILIFSVFGFQNCGNVKVAEQQKSSVELSSVAIGELTAKAPTEFESHKRIVIMLDMSYSTVSGPCPFDIDISESIHGFTGKYKQYDPNFPDDHNLLDGRARVFDCSVDLSLKNGEMKLDRNFAINNNQTIPHNKTHQGSDFNGFRFKIVREWLKQLRESRSSENLQRTRILLVPSASGLAFDRLIAGNVALTNLSSQFLLPTDPRLDSFINYLEAAHNEARELVLMEPRIRFETADPDLVKNKLGTSSFSKVFESTFKVIDSELKKLALSNDLIDTTTKLILLFDERSNVLSEQIEKVTQLVPSCVTCKNSVIQSWGLEQDVSYGVTNLNLNLMQGLPKFYGSSFFTTEFVQLSENSPITNRYQSIDLNGTTRIGDDFPSNQKNFMKSLEASTIKFNNESNYHFIKQEKIPFNLASASNNIASFNVTHVLVLNSNYRIDENGSAQADTDSDGVSDIDEVKLSLNPTKAHTFDGCIDSINAINELKNQCQSLIISSLCDPQLDTDGDSLNECDEIVIGTDPFDFDTDGDAIPDSIELFFKLNSQKDDGSLDANSDGLSNLNNLNLGALPTTLVKNFDPRTFIQSSLNFNDKIIVKDPVLGQVKLDSFTFRSDNFPTFRTNTSTQDSRLTYITRPNAPGFNEVDSKLPESQSLIRPIRLQNTNNLQILIRLIDPDEPLKVYWEVYTQTVEVKAQNIEIGRIDLSQFKQMRVIDRTRLERKK